MASTREVSAFTKGITTVADGRASRASNAVSNRPSHCAIASAAGPGIGPSRACERASATSKQSIAPITASSEKMSENSSSFARQSINRAGMLVFSDGEEYGFVVVLQTDIEIPLQRVCAIPLRDERVAALGRH